MDSAEKRRQLLEQTRRQYSDKREIPAIHPRYGSAYSRLYPEEDKSYQTGTFGIRLFLCFLLFAAFVAMDQQEYEVFHMDSGKLVQEIVKDLDVAEVWENL